MHRTAKLICSLITTAAMALLFTLANVTPASAVTYPYVESVRNMGGGVARINVRHSYQMGAIYDFRRCYYEDSRNCFWNAGSGNGLGTSFVDVNGRTIYMTDAQAKNLPY